MRITRIRFFLSIFSVLSLLYISGCGVKPTTGIIYKGKPFPKITFITNASEEHIKVAMTVKSMWLKNLGIESEVLVKDFDTYEMMMDNLDYDVARNSYAGVVMDPKSFLDVWSSRTGHVNSLNSKVFDAFLDNSQSAPNTKERYKLLTAAEDYLINQEVVVIPIYYGMNQDIVKSYVYGMSYNPRYYFPLKYVYLYKDGNMMPPEKQVFRFNNGANPITLDPTLASDKYEFKIIRQLFEGLLELDPVTMRVKPAVASSWDISNDGKTYTFHLRKDVLWSNGEPVTANDFYYAWHRLLMPVPKSVYAYLLYNVENAENFNTGNLKDFRKVGIKVIDDYTLEVNLLRADDTFLEITAFYTLFPIYHGIAEKYGNKWCSPKTCVVNGAFVLRDWEKNNVMTLERNENYFASSTVKLTKIVIYMEESDFKGLDMYNNDETDWIRKVPLTHAYRVKEWDEAHISQVFATYYLMINSNRKPLDDVRVRKALSISINKNWICEYILKGGQIPAESLVPPLIKGYEVAKTDPFDPKKGRRLIHDAGYRVKLRRFDQILIYPVKGAKKDK